MLESTIKTNPLGKWYIEIKDMNNEKHMMIALDIHEYAQKVEELGQKGGYAEGVEVAWSSDDDVSPMQINEVRQQIMAYEAEMEAKKEQGFNEANNSGQTPVAEA